MKTQIGSFITLVVTTTIVMYALLKYLHLLTRHNPDVSYYYNWNEHENGEVVNLNDINFKIAVTIEDYNSPKTLKNDPRYVKWMFRLHGKRNG